MLDCLAACIPRVHAARPRHCCCPDSGKRAGPHASGSRRPPTRAQLPAGSHRAETRPLGFCCAVLDCWSRTEAPPERCRPHRLSSHERSSAIQTSHCGLSPPSYCSAHGQSGRGARSAARAHLVSRPRSPWYPQSSSIDDRTHSRRQTPIESSAERPNLKREICGRFFADYRPQYNCNRIIIVTAARRLVHGLRREQQSGTSPVASPLPFYPGHYASTRWPHVGRPHLQQRGAPACRLAPKQQRQPLLYKN